MADNSSERPARPSSRKASGSQHSRGAGNTPPSAPTRTPTPGSPSVAPARAVAAHILLMVERGSAHSDDQLHSPRAAALSRQDRDLMTQLVLGTLRWERVLDREIASRLARPDAEMHLGVIVALRLGAYQLLFLDRIPPHAAIGESVELAKQADGQHAAGMVNAVLRRLAREQPGVAPPDPAAAHPEWMVARWRAHFGPEATVKLCAYDQMPAPTTLRLLDPRAEASLSAAGVVLAPGEFLSDARRLVSGDPSAALASGWARIQDEASQLVGELSALAGASATQVLDTCAAPGGKTAILLERLPGAEITAMDLSETRLRIMRRRLAGADRLRTVVGDAALLSSAATASPAYGSILCDVPCSGTGTLARNPEIRQRLEPASLGRQQQRQAAILSAALPALIPGGRLVYSTCSMEPEENEQVIDMALRNRNGYVCLPVEEELVRLAASGVVTALGLEHLRRTAIRGNFLRTIPGVHGCDGFFAAVIACL